MLTLLRTVSKCEPAGQGSVLLDAKFIVVLLNCKQECWPSEPASTYSDQLGTHMAEGEGVTEPVDVLVSEEVNVADVVNVGDVVSVGDTV